MIQYAFKDLNEIADYLERRSRDIAGAGYRATTRRDQDIRKAEAAAYRDIAEMMRRTVLETGLIREEIKG